MACVTTCDYDESVVIDMKYFNWNRNGTNGSGTVFNCWTVQWS